MQASNIPRLSKSSKPEIFKTSKGNEQFHKELHENVPKDESFAYRLNAKIDRQTDRLGR